MTSKKFDQNFKVNLWLSDVIKQYMRQELEWDLIPDELKSEVNKLTYALHNSITLSNKILKELSESEES